MQETSERRTEASRRRERLAAFFVFVLVGSYFCFARDAVFKADDYPTILYASDWGRVFADYFGSQYGLSFFVFWRPAITTSLAIDHALFGDFAAGYYAMNAVAFALSVFVLWAILRALWPERPAFAWAAALLWILHPAPVVSVHWVVGRVDTHSVLPMLLTCWLHLRYRRARAKRWLVALCMLWALASKESAIGLPLMLVGLDLLDRHPSLPGGPAFAGRGVPALVYLLALPLFFVWRKLVLGQALGGYGFLAGEALDPYAIFDGLRQSLGQSLVPGLGDGLRDALVLALVASVGIWALASRVRRRARVVGVLVLSAGIWAPLAQLLPSMRDPAQQRYAYFACLWALLAWSAFACAGAARVAPSSRSLRVVSGLLVALLPLVLLVPERGRELSKMRAHDSFCRSLTGAVDDAVARAKSKHVVDAGERCVLDPIVVGGDAEAANHPQRFLWGLTDVHRPPFRSFRVELVSLRSLAPYASPVPSADASAASCAWVEIDDAGSSSARDGGGQAPVEARWLDFDGRLDVEDWKRLVDPSSALGFEVDGDVDVVDVLTSVGSARMRVPVRSGRLSLRDLLLSNVAWKTGDASAVPLIHLILNPLDLAPTSPVYLRWRDARGEVRARFSATRAFTRTAIAELQP